VYFLDRDHGWAVGEYSTILKYNGREWMSQIVTGSSYNSFTSVFVIDLYNAWAVSGSLVYRYNGSIWTCQSNLSCSLTAIWFTKPNEGWGVGVGQQGGVIVKYDGSFWTEIPFSFNGTPSSIFFTYPNDGWVVGNECVPIRFQNNQWTYSSIPVENSFDAFSDVYFTDPNTGWAVNKYGEIFKFDGYQWTLPYYEETNFDFTSISGVSSWMLAVGNVTDSTGKSKSVLFEKTNPDNFWHLKLEETGTHYNTLYCNFQSTIWPLSNNPNNAIYYGGGSEGNWTTLKGYFYNYWSSDISVFWKGCSIYSICFADSLTGWIAGSCGKMACGNITSWTDVTSGTTKDISSLYFYKSPYHTWKVGWAVANEPGGGHSGSEILSYKSTLGSHWTSLYSDTTNLRINSIFFLNQYNGWGVGNYPNNTSAIIKTGDGGLSWTIDKTDYQFVLKSIYCVDNDHCWAVGSKGRILFYDGTGWTPQFSGTDQDLNCIYFEHYNWIDNWGYYMSGWIAGNNGTILSLPWQTLAGIYDTTTPILQLHSKAVPNPFTDCTKILYDLPKNSTVQIKIFDLNGTEILNLGNVKQEEGSHSVLINGESLKAGLYIYKIQTEWTIETGKIIKL
jgi:photosystem II stability/assembly factor-like uncharacterized protein